MKLCDLITDVKSERTADEQRDAAIRKGYFTLVLERALAPEGETLSEQKEKDLAGAAEVLIPRRDPKADVAIAERMIELDIDGGTDLAKLDAQVNKAREAKKLADYASFEHKKVEELRVTLKGRKSIFNPEQVKQRKAEIPDEVRRLEEAAEPVRKHAIACEAARDQCKAAKAEIDRLTRDHPEIAAVIGLPACTTNQQQQCTA